MTATRIILGDQKFEASGLIFECLVPYENWRITYAGLLRKGARSTWSSEVADEELEFVKFYFLFDNSLVFLRRCRKYLLYFSVGKVLVNRSFGRSTGALI